MAGGIDSVLHLGGKGGEVAGKTDTAARSDATVCDTGNPANHDYKP